MLRAGSWSLTRRFGVGPLGEFVEGFTEALEGQGYSWRSSEAQLGLYRHLSVWLQVRGLTAGDPGADVVDAFIVERRARYVALRSERALRPLLGYLREFGVAPVPPVSEPSTAAGAVLARFAQHLAVERGLAVHTVRSYTAQVRPFVAVYAPDEAVYAPDEEGRVSLTARQVTAFVTARAVGQRPRSAAVGANALRALLGWMWREGIVATSLADAVGSFAGPAGAGITGPGSAHRLRHTAACGVLASGGGLAEAGQLLRHSSPQATAVYAKSDVCALAVLARPWPVEVIR